MGCLTRQIEQDLLAYIPENFGCLPANQLYADTLRHTLVQGGLMTANITSDQIFEILKRLNSNEEKLQQNEIFIC